MHIPCCTMYIIHLPGDGIVVYTQNAYIMANGRDLSLMPDNGSPMRGQFHREGTCVHVRHKVHLRHKVIVQVFACKGTR